MGQVNISLKIFWGGKVESMWKYLYEYFEEKKSSGHVKMFFKNISRRKKSWRRVKISLRIFCGEKELRAAGGSCSAPTGNYQHWLELHGATQPASITGTNTDTLTRTITRTLTGTITRTTNTITQPTLYCQCCYKFCSSVLFTLGISSIILGVIICCVLIYKLGRGAHLPRRYSTGAPNYPH